MGTTESRPALRPALRPASVAAKRRASQGAHLMDPAPVAARIRKLQAQGWSLSRIEAVTGVSRCSMRKALNGESHDVRWDTARRILALALTPAPVRFHGVPSIGTARRLQALYALGHPLALIAEHCGLAPCFISDIVNGRKPTVSSHTAKAVRAAYGELSMAPGTSAYSRGRARSKGWAPPLVWDEEALDDPSGIPDWTGHCGTANGWLLHRVEREEACTACAPHAVDFRAESASRLLAERCPDAVEALAARGRGWTSVAVAVGLTPSQLSRAREIVTRTRLEAAA